jgi:hypothetical protein
VKTAPHFGHLIFASFCTPAHPKEKTAKITNARMILTHFLINPSPPFDISGKSRKIHIGKIDIKNPIYVGKN